MLEDVRAVCCVGAGTIGASWALVFARAGVETRVYDADPAQLAAAAARLDAGARFLAEVRGVNAGALRACLHVVNDLERALDGAAYVQECVPERLDLKRAVFAELDRLCPPDVVLGSSASAIPMSRIAAGLARPGRAVIVHPTNPPHLVPLVEVVPGERTDPAVAQAAYAFMERIGQRPILCRKEIFGFVLNRIQMALFREALYLHREGVASIADIDRCVTDGLGLRWAFLGPFGVEHTNAPSIEEDLRKFAEPIRSIFAALHNGDDLLDDEGIDRIAAEVEEGLGHRPHDELTAWRDRMILELRALKEQS
jgi:L-gulonate 3-dehydrogenase